MNGACVKWWNLLLLLTVAACALSGREARATAPARRDQISLNGAWDGGDVPQYQGFTLAGNASKTFSRRVMIPAAWAGKVVKVEFSGGVAHKAEVIVDGKLAASHIGGFGPFQVDLTGLAQPGRTFELKVIVHGSDALKNGTKYPEWPMGGWYHDKAGIQDDVWLRAYGRVAIEDAFIQTSVAQQKITVRYTVRNHDQVARGIQLRAAAVRETTGEEEKAFFGPFMMLEPGQTQTVEVASPWANPALYWPDDPVLYDLRSELIVDDVVADRETRRFGFREYTIQGRDTFWNGVKVHLFGDYQVFGDKWYMDSELYHGKANWPATVRRMKEFNMRCLRWHHNPVPQYLLDVTDELGLLICDESANYARDWMKGMPAEVKARYVANFEQSIPEWIKADRNHPSVYMWNATNEMTYSFAAEFSGEECRTMARAIRRLDPTRPVGYDGDVKAAEELWNVHYPEEYNREPKGSIYSWTGEKIGRYELPKSKPWGTGEVLHTRSPKAELREQVERNTWWLGIWTRGLRYAGWTDVRPACYWFTMADMNSPDPAVRQRSLNLRNAFAPVALFDKAYDDLGLAPYVTGAKAGGELPVAKRGTTLERTLILYNDEFKGETLTAQVQVMVDGKPVAAQVRDCQVKPGEHLELPWRVQVPAGSGKELTLMLRVRKDSRLRFEEPRRFKIMP